MENLSEVLDAFVMLMNTIGKRSPSNNYGLKVTARKLLPFADLVKAISAWSDDEPVQGPEIKALLRELEDSLKD